MGSRLPLPSVQANCCKAALPEALVMLKASMATVMRCAASVEAKALQDYPRYGLCWQYSTSEARRLIAICPRQSI